MSENEKSNEPNEEENENKPSEENPSQPLPSSEEENIPLEIERMVRLDWRGHATIQQGNFEPLLIRHHRLILPFVQDLQEGLISGIVKEYRMRGRISRTQYQQIASIAARVAAKIKSIKSCQETFQHLSEALKENRLIQLVAKRKLKEHRQESAKGDVSFVDDIEEDCAID